MPVSLKSETEFIRWGFNQRTKKPAIRKGMAGFQGNSLTNVTSMVIRNVAGFKRRNSN